MGPVSAADPSGAGDVDLERLIDLLRRVGIVHPSGRAADVVGDAIFGGGCGVVGDPLGKAEDNAIDGAEPDAVDRRSVGLQANDDASDRLADRDGKLVILPLAAHRTIDWLRLAVAGDLRGSRRVSG